MSTGVNGNRTYRWFAGLLGALTLLAATLAPSAAAGAIGTRLLDIVIAAAEKRAGL